MNQNPGSIKSLLHMMKKLDGQATLSFGKNTTSTRNAHFNFLEDLKKVLINDMWILSAGWITMTEAVLYSWSRSSMTFLYNPSSYYYFKFLENGDITLNRSLIRDFVTPAKIILEEGSWDISEVENCYVLHFKIRGYVLPSGENIYEQEKIFDVESFYHMESLNTKFMILKLVKLQKDRGDISFLEWKKIFTEM